MHCSTTLLLTLLLLPAATAAAQNATTNAARCHALIEKASGLLAAEQYPMMLRTAEERQRLCPGPVSSFLVGLAQGNMVNEQLVQDPAQGELMRRAALRNLQAAAAGGQALRSVWRFTTHDWIVHLQSMAPSSQPEALRAGDSDGNADAYIGGAAPLQAHRTDGAFPYGPLVLGGTATGALIAALLAGLAAAETRDLARENTRVIGQALSEGPVNALKVVHAMEMTSALQDQAGTQQSWSTALLLTGGIGAAASLVWYFALPPRKGWQWAATPGGAHVRGNF